VDLPVLPHILCVKRVREPLFCGLPRVGVAV